MSRHNKPKPIQLSFMWITNIELKTMTKTAKTQRKTHQTPCEKSPKVAQNVPKVRKT